MSATPEVHDVKDLTLPTYPTGKARMDAVHACSHPSDAVTLIHGPPWTDGAEHICQACGDLL